ncbi:MAG: GatB/YqeY domain-containing protein [Candidatus Muiribacteriota bacterium]
MYDKIKKEILEARKSGDKIKANLLNTLYSDAKKDAINSGKREPDNELLGNILKKFVKNAKETIELKKNGNMDYSQDETELKILESYLPKQLTEEELMKIISELADNLPSKEKKFMGQIMKQLKENYDGQFDGKLASQITGNVLQ